jgi:queuine tRNA-ribosyltransferase
VTGVRFELLGTDPASGLRAGLLHTSRGSIPTPAFLPVGTRGSVKALTPSDVRATGAAGVLANTYHLLLQPGVETVQRLGGLHGFMRWDGPILTDSGGFQVFSLDGLREINDAGVQFRSHLDNTLLSLSPESVVRAQEALGADLIMPLDVCVGATADRAEVEQALERTQAWWTRSLAARTNSDQALFALIQGGMFEDLRRQAARAAVSTHPPGFAIGGFSVGEPKAVTERALRATLAELPPNRPRYLMGVGDPRDLVAYARMGVDVFDCVLPTRLGRNGTVWTDDSGTRLDLGRRATLAMRGAIRADCGCRACQEWPVGRLAALFQMREPLAYRLASVHNLTVLATLLAGVRASVLYTPLDE